MKNPLSKVKFIDSYCQACNTYNNGSLTAKEKGCIWKQKRNGIEGCLIPLLPNEKPKFNNQDNIFVPEQNASAQDRKMVEFYNLKLDQWYSGPEVFAFFSGQKL